MEKPEHVYIIKIPERLGLAGYFYSYENAKKDCVSWALYHDYKEEDLYFDEVDDTSYLKAKSMPEDYGALAIIFNYIVQDADEYKYGIYKKKDDQLNKENNLIDEFLMMLDKFKKQTPDQVIIMETPSGTVECRIGDANIYDDPYGKIVIDAE